MAKNIKDKNDIKQDIESILSAAISNRDLVIDFSNLVDYYEEKLPLNNNENGSGYIRPICKQTVLSVESYIINQFLSADKISSSDELNSLLSYKVLNNVITDGVKFGTGALRYNENIQTEDVDLPGVDIAALEMYEADPDVVELAYVDNFDGTVDAKLKIQVSNPSIDYVDIANLFTDDTNNNIKDNNFVAIRDFVTKEEAKELGLTDENLKELTIKTRDEEYNRTDQNNSIDNEIDTYEIYQYQYNIGKITYTGIMSETKVITCEEEPLKPFDIYTWNPIPRNNTIYGLGFIDASKSTQDLTTMLYRNILNNAALSSYPQRLIDKTRFQVAEAEKLANPAAGQVVSMQGPTSNAFEDIGVPFIAAQIYDIVKENETIHFETYGIGQIVEQSALQNTSATTAAIQESNGTQKLRNYCQQLYMMLQELAGDPNVNFGMSQNNQDEERATDLAGMYQLLQTVPNVSPNTMQNIVMELGQLAKVPVEFVEPQPPAPDPTLELQNKTIDMTAALEKAKLKLRKYEFDNEHMLKQQKLKAEIQDDDDKNDLKAMEIASRN